ncbi:DEKNAAC105525 [Brettanomyces naardenensis]|uniref:DEKNAAC105525 n=1 Tax=Brettanomyces naardenensis TaxID=13370 RepID=A0A448YTQ5_BRENA|nr:DEKNAAC105525 [Brettanomyces naardenensis]
MEAVHQTTSRSDQSYRRFQHFSISTDQRIGGYQPGSQYQQQPQRQQQQQQQQQQYRYQFQQSPHQQPLHYSEQSYGSSPRRMSTLSLNSMASNASGPSLSQSVSPRQIETDSILSIDERFVPKHWRPKSTERMYALAKRSESLASLSAASPRPAQEPQPQPGPNGRRWSHASIQKGNTNPPPPSPVPRSQSFVATPRNGPYYFPNGEVFRPRQQPKTQRILRPQRLPRYQRSSESFAQQMPQGQQVPQGHAYARPAPHTSSNIPPTLSHMPPVSELTPPSKPVFKVNFPTKQYPGVPPFPVTSIPKEAAKHATASPSVPVMSQPLPPQRSKDAGCQSHIREESSPSVSASQQSLSTENTNSNSSSNTACSSSTFSNGVETPPTDSPMSSVETRSLTPPSIKTETPNTVTLPMSASRAPATTAAANLEVIRETVVPGLRRLTTAGSKPSKHTSAIMSLNENKKTISTSKGFKNIFKRFFGSSSTSSSAPHVPTTRNSREQDRPKKKRSFLSKSVSTTFLALGKHDDHSAVPIHKPSKVLIRPTLSPVPSIKQKETNCAVEESELVSTEGGLLTVDFSETSSFSELQCSDLFPDKDKVSRSPVHSIQLDVKDEKDSESPSCLPEEQKSENNEESDLLHDLGSDEDLDYLSTIIGLGETAFFKSDSMNGARGEESIKSKDDGSLRRQKSIRIRSIEKKRSLNRYDTNSSTGTDSQSVATRSTNHSLDIGDYDNDLASYYRRYKSGYSSSTPSPADDVNIITNVKPKQPLLGVEPTNLKSCLSQSVAHYNQSQYDPRFTNGYIEGVHSQHNSNDEKEKSSKVTFSAQIYLNETHSPEDYDRYNLRMKQMYSYLSANPRKVREIRVRLNNYKKYEMQVHELSRRYTHFFRN